MGSSGGAHLSRLGKTVLGAAERRGRGEAEQSRAVRGRRCSQSGCWLGEDATAMAGASFSPVLSFSFLLPPSFSSLSVAVAVEEEDTEAARVFGGGLGGFLRRLR
jgi:hypothetical protein